MARKRRPWKRRARRAILLASGVLLIFLAAEYGSGLGRWETLQSDRTYRVTRIVDGDTLVLDGGHNVRLIGVDTPEEYPCRKLENDAARSGLPERTIIQMGRAATRFVVSRVHGRAARIELDPANRTRRHRDRYGRHLAYVFLIPSQGTSGKDVFLNRELVRYGYARTTSFPHPHQKDFRRLERRAKRTRVGLWAERPIP